MIDLIEEDDNNKLYQMGMSMLKTMIDLIEEDNDNKLYRMGISMLTEVWSDNLILEFISS